MVQALIFWRQYLLRLLNMHLRVSFHLLFSATSTGVLSKSIMKSFNMWLDMPDLKLSYHVHHCHPCHLNEYAEEQTAMMDDCHHHCQSRLHGYNKRQANICQCGYNTSPANTCQCGYNTRQANICQCGYNTSQHMSLWLQHKPTSVSVATTQANICQCGYNTSPANICQCGYNTSPANICQCGYNTSQHLSVWLQHKPS